MPAERKTKYQTRPASYWQVVRIILLLFFGSWFACKLYQTYQEDSIFDGLLLFAIALAGVIVFIWSIYKDYQLFKISKKKSSYLPTIIGLLLILVNSGLSYYQDNKIHSPSLIKGFYDGGFNGFLVDFKKDGHYVVANGSGLGQSYFYGKYTIRDSIITIDKSSIDNCIQTNRLAIKTDSYYPKDSIELLKSKANYITQIDQYGNEVDRELRFRVTEDNRERKDTARSGN